MYLGVDGGGTKTAFCLVTDDGRVAAALEAPTLYYLGKRDGIALVARALEDGVAEVCRVAGITPADIAYAFVALPAYGEVSADIPALDATPAVALGHQRYACGNDMVAGWAGSLGAADGINVVSGTGSICYGEHAGRRVRVGGWGELFGDEGSGHWIGLRGLQLFSQMSDGRRPAGPLLDVMRHHFSVVSDLDVVAITMGEWKGDRRRVAALSTVVADAAGRGDEQAQAILDEAAAELVSLVDTARRALAYEVGEPVAVSHSGGVFSSTTVRDEFVRLLTAAHPDYDFREPLYRPVVGAAVYAARLAGTPLSAEALARLGDPASSGAATR
jgi:N-acetylglucosamine kinase-like BadF-type ATPase